MKNKNDSLLLVANWDSGTKYAWWLIESFWLLLGEHYSGKQKEVYLVYPGISTIPNMISESQINVEQLNFNKNDLVSLFRQCSYIRQRRIGTIYFTDYPSCSVKYLIFRLAGVKYIIVHEHVPGVRHMPGKTRFLIKKLIHRMPLICASGLIAATEYVRRRHIEVTGMPEESCYCAANGIPESPSAHPMDLFKAFGIPENRKIMVTTGRANKYKGIDFVLSILAMLVNDQKIQNIHYLFCGDGPALEIFKSTAKSLGINDYVTFAGQLNNVTPYLESCDFAIHPSKGEVGYSLSILEYMQAGLPVIVPDNPSVCGATLDGVSGYIYRENDLSDAAVKVVQLLSSTELINTMGGRAKQLVIEKYRLSDTHDQLLQAVSAITSA